MCSSDLFDAVVLSLLYMFFKLTHTSLDPLSRLPNQSYLYENFLELEQKNTDITLILIDIDKLNDINKDYSYEDGNFVIRTFGKALSNKYKNDLVAFHNSSDEFVIILNTTDDEIISEKLLEIETIIKNENMNLTKKYSIDYTAVYEKYNKQIYKNIFN